jgi:hypothetical protein
MVSRVFPAYHPRKGQDTDFQTKIYHAIKPFDVCLYKPKLHTIRGNYALQERRIRAVNEGKAVLSLRYWSGKPYQTKQVEFLQLKGDQVGVQKLEAYAMSWHVGENQVAVKQVAQNDGLTLDDFINWFDMKIEQEMAIIHFTKFRY